MKKNRIASVCMLAMLVAYMASAEVIAWNFSERWGTKEAGGKTVLGTDQWTDSVNYSAPNGTVVANSSGDLNAITTPFNAAGVSVAWSAPGMYQAGDEGDDPGYVFRRYLDDNGGAVHIDVTGLTVWLASVPGATGYQVTFYQNADWAGATGFAAWEITDGDDVALASTVVKASDGSGSGAGVRLINDVGVIFTADTINFDSFRDANNNRASISGFTITSIPEPATMGMVALFGGGLMFVRRRLMM